MQKSNYQRSKPRFWGHPFLLRRQRRVGLDPEGLKGGISVKGAWADVTGLVHEVVLLDQNDGAIRASHTSWDRRAPQPTLGAIICQRSWHRIWMLFDPWHTFCNAAVARRRGHGCLLMRLLLSGSFRPTRSTVRWSLNLCKTEKYSRLCWLAGKLRNHWSSSVFQAAALYVGHLHTMLSRRLYKG